MRPTSVESASPLAEHFHLRIDHFEPRGPQLVDLRFSVQNQPLAWLQPAFEVTAVKKFAGQQAAGRVLHQQVINGVAAAHSADGLAAHHLGANGVNAVGLDVLHIRKMDAIFVAKRQVREQVFERVKAALGEQFGALRADALDHAHFREER